MFYSPSVVASRPLTNPPHVWLHQSEAETCQLQTIEAVTLTPQHLLGSFHLVREAVEEAWELDTILDSYCRLCKAVPA